MQRFVLLLVFLLLLTSSGFAEIACVCNSDHCICFIQLGDEGKAMEIIQHALIEQGYLHKSNDAYLFDENTQKAILHFQETNSLPMTGMLDDNTLTLLLWGMLPEELDKTEPSGNAIWIPTDGGIRRHIRPCCCKMSDPRRVSIRNAEKLGFDPCGICNRRGKVLKELENVISPCTCNICSAYDIYQ